VPFKTWPAEVATLPSSNKLLDLTTSSLSTSKETLLSFLLWVYPALKASSIIDWLSFVLVDLHLHSIRRRNLPRIPSLHRYFSTHWRLCPRSSRSRRVWSSIRSGSLHNHRFLRRILPRSRRTWERWKRRSFEDWSIGLFLDYHGCCRTERFQ